MDRRAHPDRAHVSRRAAAREHGGGRGGKGGAPGVRALPPRLRHGGVSDFADLPRGARDRERARRPQARRHHGRERRRRFRDLQGHRLVGGLGRGGATRGDFEKMTITAVMRALAAAALLLAACGLAGGEEAKPESSRVRLAVGGKPALFYLPLTVTERLGYFRDAGLEVEISDFPGGARALQALIGGSADVVTGAYDHTIQMQAKNQPIVAVVQLGEFPGYVLAVLTGKAPGYRSPADLKGMKIGVTPPGSSTQFMAQHLMVKHGLKRHDASLVGIGASASAVPAGPRPAVHPPATPA